MNILYIIVVTFFIVFVEAALLWKIHDISKLVDNIDKYLDELYDYSLYIEDKYGKGMK